MLKVSERLMSPVRDTCHKNPFDVSDFGTRERRPSLANVRLFLIGITTVLTLKTHLKKSASSCIKKITNYYHYQTSIFSLPYDSR